MIQIRKSNERGYANHGWLESRHTFSFASYYDPEHMGFSVLRVINEDHVAPGAGFPSHGHRDMEIISYVLEGGLEHRDNMGNGSVIRPGEIQRMSAGTGVTHSEYNASSSEPVRFLQIWIVPDTQRIKPGYEQKQHTTEPVDQALHLLASPDGENGSVLIHQDAFVYAGKLAKGKLINHNLPDNRKAWVQVVHGDVTVNDHKLYRGDGAAITEAPTVSISADTDAEIILFDLP
ncbi:MAG: pirin family protein [Gammaproteobacteria bacterium]|jgi:hypothetical protein